MNILQVNFSDYGGGASRAAYRIHRALLGTGVKSTMRVLFSGNADENVISGVPARSIPTKISDKIHHYWLKYACRDLNTDDAECHTFGLYSAGLLKELNDSHADIFNLHWISDMLSIHDIGKLEKPVVWTLHDMWAFCGGEHYVPDISSARFRQGYHADNRPNNEPWPDMNRRTWDAKRRAWTQQRFTVVCPSQWLAECARQSVLFAQSSIHVIPNALNTSEIWRPLSRTAARESLGIKTSKKLILMGAVGGVTNPRKGGDLLYDTIRQVAMNRDNGVELMIYGQSQYCNYNMWPCPVHWLGTVSDDQLLAQAYSAADVMVVPSRQDNLPNTAVEAQACGTPVVAFNIGGLPDIVTHQETGWLATPFDTSELAEGIMWVLENEARQTRLSENARRQAVERFSEPVVAAQYAVLYRDVLEMSARLHIKTGSYNSEFFR